MRGKVAKQIRKAAGDILDKSSMVSGKEVNPRTQKTKWLKRSYRRLCENML